MKSIQALSSMHGRVSLITGGTGYIGQAMAECLAELGSDLVLLDLDTERLEEVTQDLTERFQVKATGMVVDLENDEAVAAVPSLVEESHGRLDVLINNAAFVGTSNIQGWVTPFEEQSVETWKRAVNVNLTSAFALSQGFASMLRASGSGSIINVASIYGVLGPDLSLYEGTPMGNPAAYSASKGGLLQLTRWLSTVLAPEIRVNAISPGGVFRNQPELFQERYISRTPLARMATEEDFKGTTAYLASDLSRYVTGQNLMVDGGWSAW